MSDDWGNPNDMHASDKPGSIIWLPVLLGVLLVVALLGGWLLGT